MALKVPEKLKKTVCDYLLKNYLPEKVKKQRSGKSFNDSDIKFFASGVSDLSESFTSGRRRIPKNYLNLKEYRSAYLLYFVFPNYLKSLFCLKELDFKKEEGRLRVLDIGTGPGTSLIAAIDHFKGRKLDLTGVDQNKNILKDASNLVREYNGNEIHAIAAPERTANLKKSLGGKYDIIFFSNILNEVSKNYDPLKFVLEIIGGNLAEGGAVIIIEPALQETTRALMNLRNLILENAPSISVVSPCLHQLACPMYTKNNRDWCHMYLDWERPETTARLDKLIGNRSYFLKFSYLVFSAGFERKEKAHIWRVVSSLLKSKGKTEVLICNHTGLGRLTLLDKDRSRANRSFEDIKRGQLIEYGGPERLTKESRIKITL